MTLPDSIVVSNRKGGVMKTAPALGTTVFQRCRNQTVLVIDMDTQKSTS